MPPTPMNEEGYRQRIEIELVKKDIQNISRLCERIDENLEKVKKVQAEISSIVSLTEQKIKMQDEVNKDVDFTLSSDRSEHNKDINELSNRINTVNRDLTSKIDATENNILLEIKNLKKELADSISQINAWRYTVMGGIALAVFVISTFAKKLF